MSRPLQLNSIVDLTLMAERNWDNRAELELVQSELRHRTTQAAAKLRDRVEMWIKDCDQFSAVRVDSKATANAAPTTPARRRVIHRLSNGPMMPSQS
jgi:metal-sulfur cluster biosynthetic enzyme